MSGMEKSPSASDPRKGPGVQDAIAEIGVIQQRIMATGAVDTEPNDLSELVKKIQGGQILPSEAIAQAREIEDGRQNYH